MNKTIVTPILFFFSVCAIVVLFPACTVFRDAEKSTRDVTSQEVAKFIGTIRVYKGDADSHYELGCYLQERKKHMPAIEEFKTALEIDPNHVKSFNGLGVSYDALGDYNRAVESYKAALKVYQNLDYVLNNLGYSYLLQGKPALAIENFKKALELDGANARYRNNLALAYAKSGQYDTALAKFKEGGDEAKAHYNIAQVYYEEGLYKEAETHFEKASLLKPSEPEIERSLKAAGSLAGITTKTESTPVKVGEATVHTPEVQTTTYEEGRAYSIPAEALERIKGPEIVQADLIEKRDSAPIQTDVQPVLPPALAEIKTRPSASEEAAKVLETKQLKLYDEAQVLELVGLQTKDTDKEPTLRIKIEVSNGNGVRHMARNVGDYLKGSGFILMYLSNARNFSQETTKIYYTKGYLREAYLLAQKLPGRQSFEEVSQIKNGNAEVSILLGKDLIPHLSLFKKG